MSNVAVLGLGAFLGPFLMFLFLSGAWRKWAIIVWILLPLAGGVGLVLMQFFAAPHAEAGVAQGFFMILLLGGIALVPWLLATGIGLLAGWAVRRLLDARRAN